MSNMAQTFPSLKLESTNEQLTANAGLALFGEFIRGQRFNRWIKAEMPTPGSGRSYAASHHRAAISGGIHSLDYR